ncbi:MAG TPA: PaaI family thioesterase [Acidimicrobiales bacterium]
MTAPDPASLLALMPFAAASGVEITSAGPDAVVGRLAWAPERCTGGGVLHGAALVTLADTLGAVCAFLRLPEGASTATTESTTHFFRAVRGGTVEGTSTVVHAGRSSIVVQTEVRDDEGRLVAHVLQSQAVLGAR